MRRLAFGLVSMLFIAVTAVAASASMEVSVPEAVKQGAPFYVSINANQPLEAVSVAWGPMSVKPEVRETDGTYTAVALLGTGSQARPGTGTVSVSASVDGRTVREARRVRIEKKTFPEQRLRVAKKMVHLSQEALDRHYREKARVKAVFESVSAERFWNGDFVRPVPGGISSQYGLRRFFNGEPRKPHSGIDFRGKKGTPIKSIAPGVVALTGNHYFSGNVVYVDHGQGVASVYCHMSAIDVKEGQFVSAGSVLGEIGSTGRVTGPHLHFGLAVLGEYVNPMPLINGEIRP